MALHFNSHVAKGEAIPDVPFEPPMRAYDDMRKAHWTESSAVARRFNRSPEQARAEKFAWLECAMEGKYLGEAALEAAGREWLRRNDSESVRALPSWSGISRV